MVPHFRGLSPQNTADLASTDHNPEGFQSELFPLQSPLLRESWLVSFPPLSNMLKFSGYSCLIGGPKQMNVVDRHKRKRLAKRRSRRTWQCPAQHRDQHVTRRTAFRLPRRVVVPAGARSTKETSRRGRVRFGFRRAAAALTKGQQDSRVLHLGRSCSRKQQAGADPTRPLRRRTKGVVGRNRHSNRHASEEAQVAFKDLMTH